MKKQNLKSVCNQLFADYPDIVSVAQVQEMLGVSRTFVYNLINDGEILALQIGISYKIPKHSIIQYLLSREKDSDLNPDKDTWHKRSSTFGEKKERK